MADISFLRMYVSFAEMVTNSPDLGQGVHGRQNPLLKLHVSFTKQVKKPAKVVSTVAQNGNMFCTCLNKYRLLSISTRCQRCRTDFPQLRRLSASSQCVIGCVNSRRLRRLFASCASLPERQVILCKEIEDCSQSWSSSVLALPVWSALHEMRWPTAHKIHRL